ncbi:hypothetical protein QCM77_29890 [Bradyrhizobium sp. SSUT18]|uniref:hypothetical protein n=1 Tax=Bradyrhizobium sp. SSUT18 TaxID=3040602 RepID=UPI002447FFD6|nr:hypothetical protein [Bradyrhizobium sp. SSUT18]MDH2404133.1 hypothetical protein [Bradyrhizobium sp. SSUT18]
MITSSARASCVGGMSTPSALAVLMNSSIFRGLLHRQVSRLIALENPTRIDTTQTERIANAACPAVQ